MSQKKFFADVGVIGVTKILVSLKGLFLLPLITKILGEESYGIWVQVIITITLLSYLFTLGLPFSLVRFLPGQKNKALLREHFYSTLSIIIFSTTAVSFILFLLSGFIAPVLFGGREDLVLLLCFAFPLYSSNLLFLNYFRARKEMRRYSCGILFQSYFEVILLYILIFSGYGLFAAVLAVVCVNLSLFIILLRVISKQIGLSVPKFSRVRELLNFGIPTIPSNFSSWIMQSSDRYLIAFFMGILAVGFYSPAYTLGFMVSYIFAPLAFVLPPTLSEIYDKNRKGEVKQYLTFSTQFLFFFAIPAFFGLLIFSRELLSLLSTDRIANEGYMVVPIVAISAVLWGLSSIYSQSIVLAKKTKLIGSITIFGALTNFVLNLLLIPFIGIIGAAIATLISFGLLTAGKIYFSRRFIHFPVEFGFVFKVFAASIIMAILLYGLKYLLIVNVVILLLLIICGFALYIGLMFIIKGIDRDMVRKIMQIIKS